MNPEDVAKQMDDDGDFLNEGWEELGIEDPIVDWPPGPYTVYILYDILGQDVTGALNAMMNRRPGGGSDDHIGIRLEDLADELGGIEGDEGFGMGQRDVEFIFTDYDKAITFVNEARKLGALNADAGLMADIGFDDPILPDTESGA